MGPRLVAALIVRNEADRYLQAVLDDLETYCDRICVLDDGSTDGTADICCGYRRVQLIRNRESRFWQNEAALRQQLWSCTTRLEPEWILAIDADEMLESRFQAECDRYLGQRDYPLIGVQIHHFWGSMTHCRVDKGWNPKGMYTAMILRYLPGFPYRWLDRPLHCGRLPANAPGPVLRDGLRAKHFGYANPADQRRKYDLYVQRDPRGHYCARSHYDSILDPPKKVRLEAWRD